MKQSVKWIKNFCNNGNDFNRSYGDGYEVSRVCRIIRNRETTIIVFRISLMFGTCDARAQDKEREIERDSDIESVRD